MRNISFRNVKAHATLAGAQADRIAAWHRADSRASEGARLHPTDNAVGERSARQDRLVRKVFRWLGAAMQEVMPSSLQPTATAG